MKNPSTVRYLIQMDSGLKLNVRNNMYKKFVASFMASLMAAMTLVSPVMAATALNTYPTFLGKVGDFYVVVGKDAAASDIAGAIDVAANLAQLSYKDTTISGTTSSGLTGTERKVVIPTLSTGGQIAGSGTSQFPSKLRTFHYSGLKEGQYEYRGTKHNYHEEVELDDSGTTMTLTHSTSSPINGTLKMRMDNNATVYKYVFDDTVSSADFSAASANTTSYTNPLKVMVAGREFSIVAVPSTGSFIALVGDVKTLSDGESMTIGDLKFKVAQSFSTATAKIEITDPSGNVVKSSINTGSSESVSYGGSTYNYRVLNSGATASGVPGYAQLLAGKGDIEKTFDGSDTSTVTEFGSKWKISGSFDAASRVQSGDFIKVAYEPASISDAERYFTAGSVFTGPNNYFELRYAGLTPSNTATVTISPVTGQTLYTSTATSGYSTFSGLSGLKISTDVAGSVVNGSNGYDEAYILFNGTSTAGTFADTYYWVGFKDKSTGRITNTTTTWPAKTSVSPNGNLFSAVELTLSYGGPGAQKSFTLTAGFNNQTLFQNITIGNSTETTDAKDAQVVMAFQNKSAAVTTSPPELRLGTTSKVDTNDVRVQVESALADVSDQAGTVLADDGLQVSTVKSNTESDKVVLLVPPETVYGLIQFGKTSGTTTTTTGGTVKEVVAVTTAVAKLDTEVSSGDKTGKHLILVGSSAVNKITAEAYGVPYPTYGSQWVVTKSLPIAENKAVIDVLDGKFASGKQVVVVAGWRAEDTRLASSVLQNYMTKLTGITASQVEVSGSTLATATVTAK